MLSVSECIYCILFSSLFVVVKPSLGLLGVVEFLIFTLVSFITVVLVLRLFPLEYKETEDDDYNNGDKSPDNYGNNDTVALLQDYFRLLKF